MKYLKLFEDIEIDPFGEEEWGEEDVDDSIFDLYPTEFRNFLDENQSLGIFHKKLINHQKTLQSKEVNDFDIIKEFFKKNTEKRYIMDAFDWYDEDNITGLFNHHHWGNLTTKWILRNQNYNL